MLPDRPVPVLPDDIVPVISLSFQTGVEALLVVS
jgi:hypothetical protein